MRVIEGRLEVTLEGKTFVVTPSDGQVCIPRGQAHSLKSFKGERLVFEERTAPPGDYKARSDYLWATAKRRLLRNTPSEADEIPRFFNDLLSQPLDENFNGSFWHTMRAFYDGDTYPNLGLYFRFFDVAVSRWLLIPAVFTYFLCSYLNVYYTVHHTRWGYRKTCPAREQAEASIGCTTTVRPPDGYVISVWGLVKARVTNDRNKLVISFAPASSVRS